MGCCVSNVEDRPLSAAEAAAEFASAMARFVREGLPVVGGKAYRDRCVICTACRFYAHFQCSQCRCLTAVKAKLATENCPKGFWPVVKA